MVMIADQVHLSVSGEEIAFRDRQRVVGSRKETKEEK